MKDIAAILSELTDEPEEQFAANTEKYPIPDWDELDDES